MVFFFLDVINFIIIVNSDWLFCLFKLGEMGICFVGDEMSVIIGCVKY